MAPGRWRHRLICGPGILSKAERYYSERWFRLAHKCTMSRTLSTPCIGICSSGIGDDVCRGCKRFAHEVIDWNSYSDDQRRLVLCRLEQFLITIIQLRFEIVDIKKFRKALFAVGVRVDEDRDPYWWLYELLRGRGDLVVDHAEWGLRISPSASGLSFGELHRRIETEFFELSNAHYQRYIAPGIVAETSS